jgi:hypothetical protein
MKLIGCLLFSTFFLLGSWAFAQDSDQSSSDSGVLVSSPAHAQGSDVLDTSDQGNLNNSGQQKHQHSSGDDNSGASFSNGVVDEATSAVVSELTSSLKLTQDQISAIQPIVADNIAKNRSLQQSLVDGLIDAKTMNVQRQQLTGEENLALNSILTPDQMKVWMNMQNDDGYEDQNQNSSNNSSKRSSSK